MVCYFTPPEVRSKELGRMTMIEGTKLWKEQKETKRRNEIQEKKEVKELLENYWPWGRPGGGAPNKHNVGLRNVYLEELYPQEEIQKVKRQVGSFQFGRPGGGAPHVSKTGQKQIRFREDPALRFQWGEDLRRTVDNTLRYRCKREDQQQYKQQLDAMVEEKKKARDEEVKKQLDFERKMGWTTDFDVRRAQNKVPFPEQYEPSIRKQEHKDCRHRNHENNRESEQSSIINHNQNNGVELVPLIVRRRPFIAEASLRTTDVTRGDALPQRTTAAEPKYLQDLTRQVDHKHQSIKDARQKDIESCQKHFETWGNLWGRPGHGAPKSGTQKRQLMAMLFPQMQPMTVH